MACIQQEHFIRLFLIFGLTQKQALMPVQPARTCCLIKVFACKPCKWRRVTGPDMRRNTHGLFKKVLQSRF